LRSSSACPEIAAIPGDHATAHMLIEGMETVNQVFTRKGIRYLLDADTGLDL